MLRRLKEAKRSWIYAAIFALMLAFAWTPAEAFGPNQERLKAHVPFDFMVQGEKMEAGHYTVWTADTDNPRVMYIEQEATNDESVAFITMPVPNTWDWDEERRAHLAFQKVGDTVFLDAVFVPAHSTARRIPDSDKQDKMKEHKDASEKKTVLLETTDENAK